jgi:hypothetical protein
MVVKKKKIQKGGELQNEIFTEYFSDLFKLINDLLISTIDTRDEFHRILVLNESKSNNILFKKLINELKPKIPSQAEINNDKSKSASILRKVKNILYIIIFTRIVKFVDGETFISKLINIYIYMLFINYFILLGKLNRHKYIPIFISCIRRIIGLKNDRRAEYGSISYNNVPIFNETNLLNVKSKLNVLKKEFNIPSDFSKEEFLRRIKNFFIEKYSQRVPILYGNDYVGNLRDKKYIINPVGAFILKLYNSHNISRYKTRRLQLLRSVIGSDKIPNLKFLPLGTEFCIIKEENHEKICEEVRSCSRFTLSNSLYNKKMIAEIKEVNIASDEHILELLDILLCLYIDDQNILRTNINQNEVQLFNLSQRRPKTLSNQRRLFAERAQLQNNNNNNNNNN